MSKKTARSMSTSELATLLRVSERWIRRLVEAGMPRVSHGRFNRADCLLWNARYKLGKHEAPGLDSVVDQIRAARLRKAQADAEMAEMDLHERRGQLVPIHMYEQRLAAFVIPLRERLLNFSHRLAPQLEGEDRVAIRQKMDTAMRGLLMAVAQGDIRKTMEGDNGNHSGATQKTGSDRREVEGAVHDRSGEAAPANHPD